MKENTYEDNCSETRVRSSFTISKQNNSSKSTLNPSVTNEDILIKFPSPTLNQGSLTTTDVACVREYEEG